MEKKKGKSKSKKRKIKPKNIDKPLQAIAAVKRTPTGIKGFDKLIQGGFPKGRVFLISGTPGTCKTIFGLQYLYNGATMFDEKGMLVTIEEKLDALKSQAAQFGWDLDELEAKGKLELMRLDARNIKGITSKQILDYAKRYGVKRLVIDSLSALAINTPNVYMNDQEMDNINVMRFVYHFINDLKSDGLTIVLISQTQENELSRDTVSEFTCDGIVHIKYETVGGEYSRYLTVRKMRETKNNDDIHPLEVTKTGLKLHSMK